MYHSEYVLMVYLDLHYLGHCSNVLFLGTIIMPLAFSSAFRVMFFLVHLKSCGSVLAYNLDIHLSLESQRFFPRVPRWWGQYRIWSQPGRPSPDLLHPGETRFLCGVNEGSVR